MPAFMSTVPESKHNTMTRRYIIMIKSGKNAPQIADNVLKDFGCSVSEPSEWLHPGTTIVRGLTFLDKKGKTLESSIFKHQAYFNPQKDNLVPEETEIEQLVYDAIAEHYRLGPGDINVQVAEADK